MDKILQKALAFGIVAAVLIVGYYFLYQIPKQEEARRQEAVREQYYKETLAEYEANLQMTKEENLRACVAKWDAEYNKAWVSGDSGFQEFAKLKKDDCYMQYR